MWIHLGMACISLALLSSIQAQYAGSQSEAWPLNHWETVPAAQEGLEQAVLNELALHLGGSGCVTRRGRMVYAWGNPKIMLHVASAGKPVLMMLLLQALQEGRVESLDEPVSKWEPELGDINAALGKKDRQITWRHLVTQTSCYGVQEIPGTAFDYNDYQMALFSRVLINKVFGAEWNRATDEVLWPKLMSPLGCEDRPCFVTTDGEAPIGRLKISPRDFCRLGLLVLRGGQWAGKQLMDAALLQETLSSPLPLQIPRTQGVRTEMLPGQQSYGGTINQESHMGSYSWMWWVNGVDRHGMRLWLDAPLDAFGAFGYGGIRAMVVLPSLDMVASWTTNKLPRMEMSGRGHENINKALRLLAEAASPTLLSATNQGQE